MRSEPVGTQSVYEWSGAGSPGIPALAQPLFDETDRRLKEPFAAFSYNGKPAARLIDPAADLAAIQPGIGPKYWIMPEPK